MDRRRVAHGLAALGICALLCALAAARASAETITFAGRPANLFVPESYDPNTPAPLIVLLHGYGMTGAVQDMYMGFSAIAHTHGFLLVLPDGLNSALGPRFWNATDACCNFFGSTTDDSAYIRGLIEEARAQYAVDERRIFVTGHSNGGFMSYRMACDHAEVVAAIASFAGATWDNPASCSPSEPVHVLQVHGTADATILYGGGVLSQAYPGAVKSVETWNAYNGCTNTADTSAASLDLITSLAGAETTIARYTDGCQPGGSGELWTMQGGVHVPILSTQYATLVVQWLYAHPKPAAPPVSLLPGVAPALALAALLGGAALLAIRNAMR